VNFVNV